MRGIVGRIESAVRERVLAMWPELGTIGVEARPLLDLALGDFGIDCCLAVGATLKRRPEDVALEFVGAFPAHPEFTLTAVDGFVNARLLHPELLRPSDVVVATGAAIERRVVVQPPTPGVSIDTFARLVASGAAQVVLSVARGERAELYVGGERCVGASIEELFREAFRLGRERPASAAREEIARHLSGVGESRVTVWIAPSFLNRGAFRDFYRTYFAEHGERYLLRCPPRGWCEGFQESWAGIAQRGERAGAAALMLASSRAPGELDVYTLTLAEQGNLRWFLGATHRRLETLLKNTPSAHGDAPVSLPPGARRVALRAATIPLFGLEAVERGEVGVWIDALTDLLRSLTVWMNTPATRIALETGRISPVEREILSGACKAVSDIMVSNPLFYEVDRA